MGCGAEPREENFSVFGANLNIFEGASAQTTYNKIDRPLPKKLKESSVSLGPRSRNSQGLTCQHNFCVYRSQFLHEVPNAALGPIGPAPAGPASWHG